jgi:hypothetical protein
MICHLSGCLGGDGHLYIIYTTHFGTVYFINKLPAKGEDCGSGDALRATGWNTAAEN